MKVNRFGGTPGFDSFDITLTIESAEEATALYAIFNYCPNTNLLPDGMGTLIRKTIGEKFSLLGPDSEIAKGVTYGDFYSSKKGK